MLSMWQLKRDSLEALLEAKDHRINRLNLSDEQKTALIDIFRRFPQFESKIDWNRNDLSWEAAEYISRSEKSSFKGHEFQYRWCLKDPKIYNNYKQDGTVFYFLYSPNSKDYTKAAIYNEEMEIENGIYRISYMIHPANHKYPTPNFTISNLNAHLSILGINFQFTEEMFKE